MRDRRRWRLSGLLALSLVLLAVVTTVALTVTLRTNAAINATREEVVVLSRAADAIAAEAYAEAGYRRAPSPQARERVEQSVNAVEVALEGLRMELGPEDAWIFSRLRQINRRYVAEVEATLDAPLAERRNDRVAGPALDAMQRLLSTAVETRREELAEQTAQQGSVVRVLVGALAVTFAISFTAIGFVWRGLMREREVLQDAADTDVLTGLRNRRSFEGEVNRTLSRPGTRSALLLVDLDRFKPVNDRYGHQAGDQVLVEVARRLERVARAGDVTARLGGDEFAIFLPRGQGVEHLARRVLAELRRPVVVEGVELQVGGSVGIAAAPRHADDLVGLVRAADEALYEAKTRGRDIAVAAGAGPVGA